MKEWILSNIDSELEEKKTMLCIDRVTKKYISGEKSADTGIKSISKTTDMKMYFS